MTSLTQSLHRNAQQAPDMLATVCGERTVTWAQSLDRVGRVAAGLRAAGVGPQDRVAIWSLNSDRYHELLFATWWLGAVTVPVNTRWSAGEVDFCLRDADVACLLVDDTFAAVSGTLTAVPPVVVHCGDGPAPPGLVPYESLLGHGTCDDVRAEEELLAGIFYTGGTTGFPKGVMLSHRNLSASSMGMASCLDFGTSPGVLLHAAPMFHLADLGSWVTRNVLGGTHVLLPGFSAECVAAAVQAHAVTDLLLVPTMIQMLVDHPSTRRGQFVSLERLFYGGSPITPAVLGRVQALLPHTDLVQAYGMTELAPVATVLRPYEHHDPVLLASAGRAAPHSEVRVVDPDGRELAAGTVGEIVVSGANVMLGYWCRPEETAEAVRDGWMRTGDAGRMDERGFVYVVDRIKDMVITGGENVYSTEVENALAEHPAVSACAVVGIPNDTWGETVHAVVVLHPGAAPVSAADLTAHVRARIAPYKAPRTVSFADALPLSPAGKVLKRELRRALTAVPLEAGQ